MIGPEPIIKTDLMELSLGIGKLPMMWRAKVIVNDVNKKRRLIHFSFRGYYTKFTAQNQKIY